MEYTIIENTALRASRLAFGTGSLHHVFSQSERLRLLGTAFSAGITHFDTSPYYGYGLAETALGLFMRRRRGAVTVATKVGLYPPRETTKGILGVWMRKLASRSYAPLSAPRINWNVRAAALSLDASLKRLRTDYVDILFLHEPDPSLVDSEQFLSWLERERSTGKVRYWGLAGEPRLLEWWVCAKHPLTSVLQTKDSLDRKEADLILRLGRRAQFTYGYLSTVSRGTVADAAGTIIRRALQRNQHGAILFSSRRLNHIKALAAVLP